MSAIGGINSPSISNIQSMDIETLMMMVQNQRANQLESQLKAQVEAVAKKNDQIAKLNTALSALNGIQANFPGDAKQTDKAKDKCDGFRKNDFAKEKEVNNLLKDAGVRPFDGQDWAGKGRLPDNSTYQGGIGGDATKGQIDAAIQQIKGMIDSSSNTQQMDMLRLQSLSNKRNEAFDLMTNFVKKMQDSRSSILGNMR